jgi:hypothetical protein
MKDSWIVLYIVVWSSKFQILAQGRMNQKGKCVPDRITCLFMEEGKNVTNKEMKRLLD